MPFTCDTGGSPNNQCVWCCTCLRGLVNGVEQNLSGPLCRFEGLDQSAFQYCTQSLDGLVLEVTCLPPVGGFSQPVPIDPLGCGQVGQCCVPGNITSHDSTLECCKFTDEAGQVSTGHWENTTTPFNCFGRCCGCDWCCNNFDVASCEHLREFSSDVLPDRYNAPPFRRPDCRVSEFPMGKAPPEHTPEQMSPANGRHEPYSVLPIRAIDRPFGIGAITVQCRTSYAIIMRYDSSDFTPKRKAGFLCNDYNRRRPAGQTKVRQRCVMVKRADGRHSFDCSFRPPCPERPSVCT